MNDIITTVASNKDSYIIMMPTRQCLICESLENPKADTVRTDWAWLCPECKKRVFDLIYGGNK